MSSKTPITKQSREEAFTQNSGDTVSLCIARVFPNIGWRRIKRHMIEAKLGFVERIDVIPVQDKDGVVKFKRAFVHFRKNSWNNRDPDAREALKRLRNHETIKLVYEDPWWWNVNISTAPKPDEAPKPPERKTRIVEPEEKVPDESYRPVSPTYSPDEEDTVEAGEVLENA
ncbi:MAG: hypothetical protein HOK72_04730 [Flavobacteriales bacterium]|jgi:hypothetical protein|nr:hypothetical protein [Flavobacteriales bacterium]